MEDFRRANRPAKTQEAQRRIVERKTDREPHYHRKDETGYGLSTGEASADESTHQNLEEVIAMTQFEVGKSYRASNNETYTVTKRTGTFVTFASTGGTRTFRRKPCCHIDGYEWVEVPGYGGWRLCAYDADISASQPEALTVKTTIQPAPVISVEVQEVSEPEITSQLATLEQQEADPMATTRDIVSRMTLKQMHEIARLVGYKGFSTKAKSYLNRTLGCRINTFMDDFYDHALVMPRDTLMKIAEVCGTEYLRWLIDDITSRLDGKISHYYEDEQTSRKHCLDILWQLFEVINFKARKHEKVREIVDSSALESTLELSKKQIYIDYDAAFDETAYSPDVQEVSVIVDDIPADHEPDIQEVGLTLIENKYEQLVSYPSCNPSGESRLTYAESLSMLELVVIANRLKNTGVHTMRIEYCDKPRLITEILKEIAIREQVTRIKNCFCRNDVQSLKRTLAYASKDALERVARELGLGFLLDIEDAVLHTELEEAIFDYCLNCINARTMNIDLDIDEPAYVPDYQENLSALDDVPESRILDTQEVGIAVYEAMEEAYEVYIEAEDKYLTSHKKDMTEKAKSDAAFRKYLTLLYEYRRCGMPKREEALNWVREYCRKSWWPEDSLSHKHISVLETLCHKCGIHAADFKEYCNRHDMAVMLLREAGIETREPTEYEQDVELRKELQSELHKYWQKRHALRKAQRIFGAGSADAEALNGMWEQYQEEADLMLYKYKAVAMRLKKWREYEADSRGISPASIQEVKPTVVTEVSEPEVQVVLASKPKATRVYRKKSSTPIKKSHAQTWKHYPQLIKKASRHIPSIKPLVKLGKSASTVRVKKF